MAAILSWVPTSAEYNYLSKKDKGSNFGAAASARDARMLEVSSEHFYLIAGSATPQASAASMASSTPSSRCFAKNTRSTNGCPV